jgi:hypothetical protein
MEESLGGEGFRFKSLDATFDPGRAQRHHRNGHQAHPHARRTTMSCKDCESSKGRSRQDQAKSLAEHALALATSLPDDVSCQKLFKKHEADFLMALRNIAAGLAYAHTWSDSEARSRADGFRFADAALTFGLAAARINNGGGSGPSCTASCDSDRQNCTSGCDIDPGAGYFCYFDCRLSYMACLARCITHGVFGSGVIIA